MNKIDIVFTGFSKDVTETVMEANCTTTLIRGQSTCIIVDTRTAWDGEQLVSELSKRDISPDDVTHVVCTHGHSDHIGCNYLFLKAREHIVGRGISTHTRYQQHDFDTSDYALDEGIRVVATPGHTLDSVSVIVENTDMGKCVAVCGDLFENADDWRDESVWIAAGSESEKLQREQRHRIAQMADFVIPGHGGILEVNSLIRATLKSQIQN